MTEPLPEKIQDQLNQLRMKLLNDRMTREEIAEALAVAVLNAYNLGKDPSYEVTPIT